MSTVRSEHQEQISEASPYAYGTSHAQSLDIGRRERYQQKQQASALSIAQRVERAGGDVFVDMKT